MGTELLLGHTVNTDTTIIARELSALGIDLLFSCTVGDNAERLRAALREALSRSDVVITTGGLGPTGDDLTKETIAEAAGVELVLHEESRQRIETYFKGRYCGENQYKQAMLPKGCTVFPNDAGHGAGLRLGDGHGQGGHHAARPPSEMELMLKRYAVPYLAQREQAIIVSRMVRVFGIGEGAAEEKIRDLTEGANPTAATYAKENEMFVRITAKAATEQEAAALCEPVVREVCVRLGEFVYGVDVESLEEVVVHGLQEKGLHLATAESCTGGLVAKRLTDVPGASEVFEMGAVTYSNDVKSMLLGVPEELFPAYGAVSEPVAARPWPKACGKKAGASLGLGITGLAGPGGGTPEKPVGLVYMALSDGTHTWVRRMDPAGPRQEPHVGARPRGALCARYGAAVSGGAAGGRTRGVSRVPIYFKETEGKKRWMLDCCFFRRAGHPCVSRRCAKAAANLRVALQGVNASARREGLCRRIGLFPEKVPLDLSGERGGRRAAALRGHRVPGAACAAGRTGRTQTCAPPDGFRRLRLSAGEPDADDCPFAGPAGRAADSTARHPAASGGKIWPDAGPSPEGGRLRGVDRALLYEVMPYDGFAFPDEGRRPVAKAVPRRLAAHQPVSVCAAEAQRISPTPIRAA